MTFDQHYEFTVLTWNGQLDGTFSSITLPTTNTNYGWYLDDLYTKNIVVYNFMPSELNNLSVEGLEDEFVTVNLNSGINMNIHWNILF